MQHTFRHKDKLHTSTNQRTKPQSSYLMQTMKYTCFALLQRWPTSTTQKDSFNTEGLTCDTCSYSTTFPSLPHSVPHMHWDAWLCADPEQRAGPMKFLHVYSVIGIIMGVPLQTVKANTSLTVIWTQTTIMEKKKILLVFVGTLVHFRSLSHTYSDRSVLSFPDTSLSKASPALVNWAAPSSFSLE